VITVNVDDGDEDYDHVSDGNDYDDEDAAVVIMMMMIASRKKCALYTGDY